MPISHVCPFWLPNSLRGVGTHHRLCYDKCHPTTHQVHVWLPWLPLKVCCYMVFSLIWSILAGQNMDHITGTQCTIFLTRRKWTCGEVVNLAISKQECNGTWDQRASPNLCTIFSDRHCLSYPQLKERSRPRDRGRGSNSRPAKTLAAAGCFVYREVKNGWYVVGWNFFLLLLTCSAWLCLGPA